MHTQKKSRTAPVQALIPRCQIASACVAAADPSAPVIRNRRRPYQAHDGPYSPVESDSWVVGDREASLPPLCQNPLRFGWWSARSAR
jgi:hypothetical protein